MICTGEARIRERERERDSNLGFDGHDLAITLELFLCLDFCTILPPQIQQKREQSDMLNVIISS